ncbi:hypothetical protein [Lutimonas zeaxanthinifaciens]|uniref:hypothetical protein n=1 Tax=Lutimonas zeaxanthinifaciens TaxID=3060215 RepID=UPI00265D124C|nr:hypothetical protein [Lutimonas sp. YSD2104]WKK67357.1 hypothetical protein QZH61_06945 [Lutimonas sp. YSD2104]
MKIGFVVHFFDFRNDVRRLITEVAKTNEVVLFVKSQDLDNIKKFNIQNVSIRVINEKIPSLRNRLLGQIYFFFKKLPKSTQNFYLMEYFKINNLKKGNKAAKKRLDWVKRLPKIMDYDSYLSKLSFSEKTNIRNLDRIIFFTEIADDFFLSRCIKENLEIFVYAYSWDHAYKHTRFSNRVKYLTWSDGTKQDIIDLQGIDKNRIKVWGSGQFAYIHEVNNTIKEMSRSFEERYIYYVCAIGIEPLVPDEINIIKTINSIIKQNAPELNFVVRPYPVLDNWDYYEELRSLGIILDDDFRTQNLSIEEDSIFRKFEKIHNAELLLHLGTTMGLEASFFKTPTLLIDFGYDKSIDKALSINNFVHQGQNDKYLVKKSKRQWIQNENELLYWLEMVVNSNATNCNQNHIISEQFNLRSFESLAKDLIDI